MAMNKKERAEFEALRKEKRLALALRWTNTAPITPDLPAPKYGEGFIQGWAYNFYTAQVYEAWSESVSHGTGQHSELSKQYRVATQGAHALYSTRELALRAMRYDMERRFAGELLKVDLQLEQES